MKMEKVWAVYWSATGTTEKVVSTMAEEASKRLRLPLEKIDFTLPCMREKVFSFQGTDLVFFGTPTYAGRVPNKVLPFVQSQFAGNGALAVSVVLFGNRSFDNSLAELASELESHGFHTVVASAFVGQHAFSDVLAAGRPAEADLRQAADFASQVADKVSSLTALPGPIAVPGDPEAPYYVPKGVDGQSAKFLKAKPKTDPEKCVSCGLCASICPMGAIDPADVSSVPGLCIKCHACIKRCPTHAKYLDDPAFLSHKAMLEQTFSEPKVNVVIL